MNKSSSLRSRSLAALLAGCCLVATLGHAQTNTPTSSARTSPDWLRSAVVYEIFPRNFSSEGTFNAITARLDELNDLGVNLLWLMPIHPIGQERKKGTWGSPYAVRDFMSVNPRYGTEADLKRLVEGAHARDMKVLLDIVAGHTAWDSVLMNRKGFYRTNEGGKIISPNPGWTDVAALNYENEELRAYMIDMLKYWVREYHVDGFRCDVAFTVPIGFWETAHTELEALNPEIVMIADANAAPQLLAKAFDMDNSWPLFYALNRVMGGLSPTPFLASSWENTRRQFPAGALHLRFSDNHQETRTVARWGVNGALAAQVFMLTLDGVPMFYNGMEVGDATESADPALFEKLPVFWTPAGRPPLREIYRDLIQLRNQNAAFRNDEVVWLNNSGDATVTSYLRRDDQNEFLVLINLSSQKAIGKVELANAAAFKPVSIHNMVEPTDPLPNYSLGGYQWQIHRRQLSE